MSRLLIRDMDSGDHYFVGTCTHVGESDEIDASSRRRLAWLKGMYDKGLRAKVAVHDSERVGFLHVIPIEVCPWGPLGRDLMVIPCLVVEKKAKGRGIGRALIDSAEEETRAQGRKGLVTTGYYHDFWFMPAPFFEKCGFSPVGKAREVTSEGEREYLGKEVLLWKVLDSSAERPEPLKRSFDFEPLVGKVAVDLVWNTFCQTSNIEAERVREVVEEFEEGVVLREWSADDPSTLAHCQMSRGIFINGDEIGWGYEAPKEGIREAISQELMKLPR